MTIKKTTLEAKIEKYNASNPNNLLTQKSIDLAIKINKLRKQEENFAKKGNQKKFQQVVKERFEIMDNNNQARFFAEMIKNI